MYSWFMAMNTRVDIVICDKDEQEAKRISDLVYDKIIYYEKIGSFFDTDSELSYLNREGSNALVVVSEDLFGMIAQALSFYEPTLGYFDVTIHSEPHNKNTNLSVELIEKDSTVFFEQQGTKIDLSGFIKGYTLDQVKAVLDMCGVNDALVNMGNSSIMALGNHPYGQGWKLAVDSILSGEGIVLYNQCLTTSGNNNTERKHIINPFSNEYVEGEKQISVVTETAAEGEALSTALFSVSGENIKGEILKNFKANTYN